MSLRRNGKEMKEAKGEIEKSRRREGNANVHINDIRVVAEYGNSSVPIGDWIVSEIQHT